MQILKLIKDERVLRSKWYYKLRKPTQTQHGRRFSSKMPLWIGENLLKKKRVLGTPDYMAPEMIEGHIGKSESNFCY